MWWIVAAVITGFLLDRLWIGRDIRDTDGMFIIIMVIIAGCGVAIGVAGEISSYKDRRQQQRQQQEYEWLSGRYISPVCSAQGWIGQRATFSDYFEAQPETPREQMHLSQHLVTLNTACALARGSGIKEDQVEIIMWMVDEAYADGNQDEVLIKELIMNAIHKIILNAPLPDIQMPSQSGQSIYYAKMEGLGLSNSSSPFYLTPRGIIEYRQES